MKVKEWMPGLFVGIAEDTIAMQILYAVGELEVENKAQAYVEVDAALRSTKILVSNLDARLRSERWE